MTAVIFLFADEPDVAPTSAGRALVRLHGVVKRDTAGPGRVELALRTPRGDVRRFHDLELALGSGVAQWSRTVPVLEAGVHRATWRYDDAVSNEVAVTVRDADAPAAGAGVTVEPIPALGIAGEPDLLVRLVNRTGATIDRGLAFHRCVAIVDGERCTLRGASWDGQPELAPGAQTWFLLALDDFTPRPTPGEHDVILELAGERSQAVRVTIPAR